MFLHNNINLFSVDNCDAIRLIDGTILAVTIFSAIATILTLAGSILGCIGTCGGGSRQVGITQPPKWQMISANSKKIRINPGIRGWAYPPLP